MQVTWTINNGVEYYLVGLATQWEDKDPIAIGIGVSKVTSEWLIIPLVTIVLWYVVALRDINREQEEVL